MTAKDLISPTASLMPTAPQVPTVSAYLPAFDVLHRLLESNSQLLNVVDPDGTLLGVITPESLLQGLSHIITTRDDSSLVIIECTPQEFSASLIARAVEDADAHLTDMLTATTHDGQNLRVTLRVRLLEPTPVVRSLERYGFNVPEAYGASDAPYSVALERLAALRSYLNT